MVAALTAMGLVLAACGRDADSASTGTRPPSGGTAPVPTQMAIGGTAPVPTTGTAGVAPSSSVAPPASNPSTTKAFIPFPEIPSTTAAPAAPPAGGPHKVATTSLPLSDSSRKTVSKGKPISASRSLPTTVYYPSDGGGPYPLIVFAHGFEIGPGPYSHICQVMAMAGYVVAAPSFPLTDRNAAGGNLDRGDLPNQAGDVGFVITSVSGAGGPLAGKVDGGKVGVVGHSDGADTALDVGYYPFRTDGRVRGVVAFAPDAMTGPGGSTGTAPLLLEHGDKDSIVPYSNSVTVFGQVKTHRFFLTFNGADHLNVVQGAQPWAAVHEQVLIDFLDRYVAGRTGDDGAVTTHGNRAGVSSIKTA